MITCTGMIMYTLRLQTRASTSATQPLTKHARPLFELACLAQRCYSPATFGRASPAHCVASSAQRSRPAPEDVLLSRSVPHCVTHLAKHQPHGATHLCAAALGA